MPYAADALEHTVTIAMHTAILDPESWRDQLRGKDYETYQLQSAVLGDPLLVHYWCVAGSTTRCQKIHTAHGDDRCCNWS